MKMNKIKISIAVLIAFFFLLLPISNAQAQNAQDPISKALKVGVEGLGVLGGVSVETFLLWLLSGQGLGSVSFSIVSQIISAISFNTLMLVGIIFTLLSNSIGIPTFIYGIEGLVSNLIMIVISIIIDAVLIGIYSIPGIGFLLILLTQFLRSSVFGYLFDGISYLSVFGSLAFSGILQTEIMNNSLELSNQLKPLFFEASLKASQFLTPILTLLSPILLIFGIISFIPNAVLSLFLFIFDVLFWTVELISGLLSGVLLFPFVPEATLPFVVYMGQLIEKYIIICKTLGVDSIKTGFEYLSFGGIGILPAFISFVIGIAFIIVPVFGAIITAIPTLLDFGIGVVASFVYDLPIIGFLIRAIMAFIYTGFGTGITVPFFAGGSLCLNFIAGIFELLGEAFAVIAFLPISLSIITFILGLLYIIHLFN